MRRCPGRHHGAGRGGGGSTSLVVLRAASGETDAAILRRGPWAARMPLALPTLRADHGVDLGGCMPPLDSAAPSNVPRRPWAVDPGGCMPPLDSAAPSIVDELPCLAPELDMAGRVMLVHARPISSLSFFITATMRCL